MYLVETKGISCLYIKAGDEDRQLTLGNYTCRLECLQNGNTYL